MTDKYTHKLLLRELKRNLKQRLKYIHIFYNKIHISYYNNDLNII